jgi:hypothetical protein
MLGKGWSLTPETAGNAWREAQGPAYQPISAWVRRRPEAAVMMIGGRNLGQCGEPDVRFEATIDGRALESWIVAPDPGFFLRPINLPAGSLKGRGDYAEVRVSARAADGVTRRAAAAIEQFDVQSVSKSLFGFDTGWYQLEFDPEAKKLWRWTGPWAALRVHDGGRDLMLRLTGDSPLKYLDRTPTVTLRAGDHVLTRLKPRDDFSMEALIPAEALSRANGVITLESDVTFVPDDRLHNGDRRPLGLRIFDVTVDQR